MTVVIFDRFDTTVFVAFVNSSGIYFGGYAFAYIIPSHTLPPLVFPLILHNSWLPVSTCFDPFWVFENGKCISYQTNLVLLMILFGKNIIKSTVNWIKPIKSVYIFQEDRHCPFVVSGTNLKILLFIFSIHLCLVIDFNNPYLKKIAQNIELL